MGRIDAASASVLAVQRAHGRAHARPALVERERDLPKLELADQLGEVPFGARLKLALGVAALWGITITAVNAAASWAAFRAAVVRFMTNNAANDPVSVRLLRRPEVFETLDDTLIGGTAMSEWGKGRPARPLAVFFTLLSAPFTQRAPQVIVVPQGVLSHS